MPKRHDIKKVMVIGSGPIVIGQAAEFDYAGTQACKSLREEGIEVVLVNSNPATIMTDANIADTVYLEPLDVDFLAKIIEKERPDGLLPTLGGQTGLNLAFRLSRMGVLDEYGVCLLGTPLSAIEKAEDRELFKATMQQIGEPVPESTIVSSIDEAIEFARQVGYPLIVRPAYTLGGTGGGIAEDESQLREIASKGLKNSIIKQVLIEKSVAGWKEIEYEVMRDSADNCITVCNMENIDPVGIHTGDSIVVAPSQTLTDKEYQLLRTASLRIIRALGIEGGCNVQFALSPDSLQYYVIEVNPRVSRSSALASKATGYPIAKVAAKIAIGMTLDEIPNAVTGKTLACFEPALDYVVVKIPRWPFDKFTTADRRLGTQMKATGEVMAIDRSFEGALGKAIRSLEMGVNGLSLAGSHEISDSELRSRLRLADDERLFLIGEALRRGWSEAEICSLTRIDPFFIRKIQNVVSLEWKLAAELPHLVSKVRDEGGRTGAGSPEERRLIDLLSQAKAMGISDPRIEEITGLKASLVSDLRKRFGIKPVYKMVDTCAAEFEASTPYYYSTYDSEDEVEVSDRKKVMVLGSGPIRIGQGIEFDYCSVHSVWALRESRVESVIVNNNPETVSTDFDTSDKLYFEPLTEEDVLHVCEKEGVSGAVVQFGGQTAINLAAPLDAAGIQILGTSVESIDLAEDRDKFEQLMTKLGVRQTEGKAVYSIQDAMGVGLKLGFPLLVRPSYVLGGRAMEVVHSEQELFEYMKSAAKVSPSHPVLIDRYIAGKEVEVDAISDGETVVIPGIMEHIERAGVHSGDSMAVFPSQTLAQAEIDTIVDYTILIARAMDTRGLINIQYVVRDGQVYVLEVNPRASRTVPFLSKVTGVPMVSLATKVMLGRNLRSMGYENGLMEPPPFVTVKAPVFSFEKLGSVDVSLGPEMKSTGEVLGLGDSYAEALYKALIGAGLVVPMTGTILVTLADKDKVEAGPILEGFAKLGFKFCATSGTAGYLDTLGIQAETVLKIGEGNPNVIDFIREGKADLIINTPTKGKIPARSGFKMRRAAVEYRVPCLTSLDTVKGLLEVIENIKSGCDISPRALSGYTGPAVLRSQANFEEKPVHEKPVHRRRAV